MTLEQRVELTERVLVVHAARLAVLERRVAILTLAAASSRRREELVAEDADD
jgi:hypothetical protein